MTISSNILWCTLILITNITQFIVLYLLFTKKMGDQLEKVNYWLKVAHDKSNEANNLRLRVNELTRKVKMI